MAHLAPAPDPSASTLAILTAAAIYFLITGLQMHHTYTADLANCTPRSDCANVLGQFQQSYNAAFNLTQLLVIAAPALIGIFWGAPLIARELETGTNQLAWNQSVTRTRWLAVKLAGLSMASMATAAVLSLLVTWWAGPLDHVSGNRFGGITFSTRDVVPLAYAVFAFALGATAGLVLRRTVPAMALTLAVFIGIQILVPNTIRPNLLPSTTVTFPINGATARDSSGFYTSGGGAEMHIVLPVPEGAWLISAPPVEDSSGHVVPACSRTRQVHRRRLEVPASTRSLPASSVMTCTRAHLPTGEPLLAASVVREWNLPSTCRRAVRLLLLVDPAPSELTSTASPQSGRGKA